MNIAYHIGVSTLLIISTATISLAKDQKNHDSYVIQCDDMARKESKSWSAWGESRGIPENILYNSASNTCLSGLLVARDAQNISDIDNWSVDMFNKNSVLGLSALNINSVHKSTEIAKKYFNNLHNIHDVDNVNRQKSKGEYPLLSDDASQQDKVSAMNNYANSKKIRGISITKKCEYSINNHDFTYGFSSNEKERAKYLKDVAISACKAVMVNNVTNGDHGMTADKILSSNSLKSSSIDKTYIKRVTGWAWQESKK
ncbi:MAG: hypothetical protein RR068_00035 [Hafnia sp.]